MVWTLLWPVAAGAQTGDPLPTADPGTADVYEAWRDRVVQVRVVDRQAGGKAGIGSGFVAGRRGWVVTNYHVVAEVVNEPGRYAVSYLSDTGSEGDLKLLAVDAVHDLALLQASDLAPSPLTLGSAPPPRGTRLWSIGFPFDIGLTIVEGSFSGRLQRSLYDRLHFTGSINPGMSGGPALDARGAVVGVNVSTAGNQVSFLVPVRFVHELLDQGAQVAPPVAHAALREQLAAQLLENQQWLTERLLADGLPVTRLNGFAVPGAPGDFVNCWGNSEQDEESRLDTVVYQCQTEDDIYLSRSQESGIVRYQHNLVSSTALGPMRFYRQLENRGYYPDLHLDGDERSVTNYACRSGFVEQSELPLKVTWCVRSYRELDGLYDAFLTATSLVENRTALQSSLVLGGFSWENLERLAERFLGAFQWQP
jgi:hypothetical protein